MSKEPKRPKYANQLAKLVVDAATSESDLPENQPALTGKSPAAVELGRLGGKKGGPARARSLTPEQRKAISKKAAAARWSKPIDLKLRQQQLSKEIARARKNQALQPHKAEKYRLLVHTLEIRLDEVNQMLALLETLSN